MGYSFKVISIHVHTNLLRNFLNNKHKMFYLHVCFLLFYYSFFLSDQVMEGDVDLTDSNSLLSYTVTYGSGTTIASFPINNSYLYFADLKDQSKC